MDGKPLPQRKWLYLLAAAIVVAFALIVADYFIAHDGKPKPFAMLVFAAFPFFLAIVSPIRAPFLGRLLIVTASLIVAAFTIYGLIYLCGWLSPH